MNSLENNVEVNNPEETRPVPPMRVFEIEYSNGQTGKYSSHYYDTSTGHLVFMDEVTVGKHVVMHYRRTVAHGQWRQVTEITGAPTSGSVN